MKLNWHRILSISENGFKKPNVTITLKYIYAIHRIIVHIYLFSHDMKVHASQLARPILDSGRL